MNFLASDLGDERVAVAVNENGIRVWLKMMGRPDESWRLLHQGNHSIVVSMSGRLRWKLELPALWG